MEAQKLLQTNAKALANFVEQYHSESADKIRDYLKSWNYIWPRIRIWLIHSDDSIFQDRITCIENFIYYLSPENVGDFKNLRHHLTDSFVLHEEFWNQFFFNILKAKSLILERFHL